MKTQTAVREPSSEVDLTPMLDVVFILLIFFIVTTSFIKEKSLNMEFLPESNSSSGHLSALFTVDSNNNVIFENRVINEEAIRSVLAQKLAENPEGMSLIVNAHEGSSVETYVAILDAAEQANVKATVLKTHK